MWYRQRNGDISTCKHFSLLFNWATHWIACEQQTHCRSSEGEKRRPEMRLLQPRSQSSSAISDVTSPVKLVGKIRLGRAWFQASSGHSDSAKRPGYEAASAVRRLPIETKRTLSLGCLPSVGDFLKCYYDKNFLFGRGPNRVMETACFDANVQ